jgi:hypothetical protein
MVRCLTDSRIVVDQIAGRSAVHAAALKPLHMRAVALVRRFRRVEFVAIPRELNHLADALAWEALEGTRSLIEFVIGRQQAEGGKDEHRN